MEIWCDAYIIIQRRIKINCFLLMAKLHRIIVLLLIYFICMLYIQSGRIICYSILPFSFPNYSIQMYNALLLCTYNNLILLSSVPINLHILLLCENDNFVMDLEVLCVLI